MKFALSNSALLVLANLLLLTPCAAQEIPKEIWGKWIVQKELPTRTISCWGEQDAKRIVGTEIEYSAKTFRWNSTATNGPVVESRTITAQQFHDENSGGSVSSSQVDFQ